MTEMGDHKPKYCPECGGTNIGSVALWNHSNWLAEPNNPDWEPFRGTSYDTWCRDCETSFDIAPGKEMNVYWFDEHPDEIPEGGNKIYNDVLLRRSYEEDENCERCGHCEHFHSELADENDGFFRVEIYCKLNREVTVKYFRPCVFETSKFKSNQNL